MADKYYVDYRRQAIVKNLDITYIAPEEYNELIIDDARDGIYKYTYENPEGGRLDFTVAQEELLHGHRTFGDLRDAHFEKHDFMGANVVSKILYVSQENFDLQVKEQGGIIDDTKQSN